MNEKNTVLNNSVIAATNMLSALGFSVSCLGEDVELNHGLIDTAYIQITALESQLTIIQRGLDNYFGV